MTTWQDKNLMDRQNALGSAYLNAADAVARYISRQVDGSENPQYPLSPSIRTAIVDLAESSAYLERQRTETGGGNRKIHLRNAMRLEKPLAQAIAATIGESANSTEINDHVVPDIAVKLSVSYRGVATAV